jgi:hypothetical protein
MVAAGLSDQLVMSAVQRSGSDGLDLTPAGLVQLKKGGVSDALVHYLLTGEMTMPRAASASAAPAPGEPETRAAGPEKSTSEIPNEVRADDGVYYRDGDDLRRIEAKSVYQTRTGSTAVSRLTFGIKKARINAKLQGLTAEVQFTQSPRFYIHLEDEESIGEYILVRFTPKQGNRELEVASRGIGKAQAGLPEKDVFPTQFERLDKSIFVLSPKLALGPGEYSLLVIQEPVGNASAGIVPRKLYDFGIR